MLKKVFVQAIKGSGEPRMLENVDVDDDLLIQYVDSCKMRILWLDEADINLKDANKILIKTEYLKRLK